VLDEHVDPAVAALLCKRGVDALATKDWQRGQWLGSSDEVLLQAARADERILVTYDVHTIADLTVKWARDGLQHSGVILVSEKSIRRGGIAGLVGAVENLLTLYEGQSLQNLVLFAGS
jgi:predicted nuclease of predicted toxin-antitoxin system